MLAHTSSQSNLLRIYWASVFFAHNSQIRAIIWIKSWYDRVRLFLSLFMMSRTTLFVAFYDSKPHMKKEYKMKMQKPAGLFECNYFIVPIFCNYSMRPMHSTNSLPSIGGSKVNIRRLRGLFYKFRFLFPFPFTSLKFHEILKSHQPFLLQFQVRPCISPFNHVQMIQSLN